MDRSGRFAISVSCPASASSNVCRGSVRVVAASHVVGSRTFSIAAGRFGTVRVRVSRDGRALLRRKSPVRVNVVVQSRGKDGVLRKRTARLTLLRR